MSPKKSEKSCRLVVPLDISKIENAERDQTVKVVAKQSDGSFVEATADFNEEGQGRAILEFDQKPESLEVAIGPADASAEEMFGLQTMTFKVAERQWGERAELQLEPIPIPPYLWFGWLRWCRTIVVRGRVLCPDGKPVPGATVCAYDVDMWWWWCSRQQVGCATTDATGAFEIRFRWCCGWWPWFWWRRRRWLLEPELVRYILPEMRRVIKEPDFIAPSPLPDRDIFNKLLVELEPIAPRLGVAPAAEVEEMAPAGIDQPLESENAMRRAGGFDVRELESLRTRLVKRLPRIPTLEHLRLWPWWPWHPWWDCHPDLIFRVTQNCQGQDQVIVDESCFDARWNVSSPLNVTLVANELACCIDDTVQPAGNCINITHVCKFPVSTIGGNLSAPAVPAGFQRPGVSSRSGDRPFAGTLWIYGDFGTLSGADYYEFEYLDGAAWEPLPLGTVAGFNRLYFGPQLPAGPIDTHVAPFPVTEIDGHRVIESRQYFEANNAPGTWEVLGAGSRWWMNNKTLLGGWVTRDVTGMPNFADGTYQLRVKSWRRVGDTLVNPQVLGQCGTSPVLDNGLVLTVDNRIVGAASGHPPSVPGHPVGPGTVHTQTLEPDTDVISVVILHADGTETPVGACGSTQINATDKLVIEFLAHDPDGHLAYYTLQATYGENGRRNLLDSLQVPSHTLTTIGADFVGPDYPDALADGATSPIWRGGKIRYEALASEVFKKTCCYQLELRAHKRTILNCHDSLWNHINYGEYSFMVIV